MSKNAAIRPEKKIIANAAMIAYSIGTENFLKQCGKALRQAHIKQQTFHLYSLPA
jgi:hypothetical protein